MMISSRLKLVSRSIYWYHVEPLIGGPIQLNYEHFSENIPNFQLQFLNNPWKVDSTSMNARVIEYTSHRIHDLYCIYSI